MAKKKQIELTIEEKLQNALVPKEKQPYKIPSNWCWSYWKYCGKFIAGNGFKNIYQGFTQYDIPYYKVGSLKFCDEGNYLIDETNTINEEIRTKLKAVKIPVNSIIFAKIGEAIKLNRRCLNKIECCIDNNLMAFISEKYFYKYIFYWTKSLNFYELTNATTVPALRKTDLENIPIPLPPLNEQQRIVNRIESLFAKLDRAKELIENTLAQFEQNKMAILHKAFTGELTVKWRKENNIDLSSWQEKTIDELCTSLKYGTSKKSNPEGSVVVLRMGNLQNGEIDWSNLMYTDDKDDIEKYLLKKGDVLFNRTNSPELVGKTSIYRGEYPAIYAGYLIKLDYGKDIIGEYLNYMMNSTKAKHYCYTVKTDGVSQSNINAKKIGAFEIPVPTIEEQQEIVNILDNLLAKYNKIKNLEQQLEKIELLKKAILAKAFRGELGTNNPDEESAENLLKEILAEK
ncbi:restriction endonuclease subunit S [Megamonas funiformis]|uniref:restriction endonuclease subunit S n=1 Tax=Megamonas funiformis TaxID=437897 RepID=UPI0026600F42|nr:restriction endonuclease subunit S [Megamonas funiformis]